MISIFRSIAALRVLSLFIAIFSFPVASASKLSAIDLAAIESCKSQFPGKWIGELSLKFVCKDPSTAKTRTDFIAIEVGSLSSGLGKQTLVCYGTALGAGMREQINYLVFNVSVLELIGPSPLNRDVLNNMNLAVSNSLRDSNCLNEIGGPWSDSFD
jgi:hypothetical protein